ncbi:MAG: basic amino acid ABC transporter substrate-binding protein [Clostridia bacterium]|nr:basic amino acid ABC transporter substrate-binding protein [Clostridia bacterium]
MRETRRWNAGARSLALALAAASALVLAACGGGGGGATTGGGSEVPPSESEAQPAETLVVGTEAEYAPFESVDANGDFVGFDMDLIRAIGKAAGFTPDIRNMGFDALIPALVSGQIDLAISAMTITDERAQSVLFSDPYFTSGQAIMVRTGSPIRTVDDLSGKKVGVQASTTGQFAVEKQNEAFQKAGKAAAQIQAYPHSPDAINALLTGQVDAVVIDVPVLEEYLKNNPGAGVEVTGPPFTVEYYGIAMARTRTDLAARVNRALAELKADGTYDAIYAKYFGGR